MKNGKKIKLSLNKQTIASLDNDALNGIRGGKAQEAQFLSIFNCSKTPSCLGHCPASAGCEITVNL